MFARGREQVALAVKLVLGVALSVLLLEYLTSGFAGLGNNAVRLALTGLLCWFLYRGASWARWLTVGLAGLGAVGMLLAATRVTGLPAVLFAAYAAAYAWAIRLLTFSAHTSAFFRGVGPSPRSGGVQPDASDQPRIRVSQSPAQKRMYDIASGDPSRGFIEMWRRAGLHIQSRASGTDIVWLKSEPVPPFLHHLSFRLGSEVFFVRIEDHSELLPVPGNRGGLLRVTNGWRGWPCVMPMELADDEWRPVLGGWGLVDLRNGEPVAPDQVRQDGPVEMTDWEVHDFAVQIVRTRLEDELHRPVTKWSGDPGISPSIWFVDASGAPAWVVVKAARHPGPDPAPPDNLASVAAQCRRVSDVGYFAPVTVASGNDPFHPDGRDAAPLMRGERLVPRFLGLQRVEMD